MLRSRGYQMCSFLTMDCNINHRSLKPSDESKNFSTERPHLKATATRQDPYLGYSQPTQHSDDPDPPSYQRDNTGASGGKQQTVSQCLKMCASPTS